MGKIASLILFFISFQFSSVGLSFSWQSCKLGTGGVELCKTASNKAGRCVYKPDCSKPTVDNKEREAVVAINIKPMGVVLPSAPVIPQKKLCPTATGSLVQYPADQECPVIAKPDENISCPTNTDAVTHAAKDESGKDIQETHCKCKYKNDTGAIGEYKPQKKYNEVNNCPLQPPKEIKKIDVNALSDSGLPCLQDLRSKVRTCVNSVLSAQKYCDTQDEENKKYTEPVNQAAGQISQVLHTSGVSRNSAQQCLQAGLLSSATGFAYDQIHNNCSGAAKTCVQDCSSELAAYTNDAQAVENYCRDGKGLQSGETEEQLQEEAKEIAGVLADAEAKCSKNKDSAEALSSDLMKLALQSNEAAKNSAACVCQVSGTCPFEDTNCVSNPSAPGCTNPFPDCTTNPTHAMCKCFGAKANDPGCKGGVSQMAALTPVTPGGSIGGTIGSGANRGGAISGLDGGGSEGEESAPSATFSGNNNGAGDEKSMFQAAQAPGSGGGGSGGGSSSGAGEGHPDGSGEPENKGLSGVFKSLGQSIKSAFGFGGGSKSSVASVKKDSKFNDPSKAQKSKLRTVATSNGYCVIKEDNSKICFGHKQTSIFEMINKGYVNQRESLLSK